MGVYFFWGEDDFAIAQRVQRLKDSILDPNWIQFNYQQISGEDPNSTRDALNEAMTPVFGMGGRLVWVANTSICQQCPEDIFTQLQLILPAIPDSSHLLFTTSKKPDKRLKSSKLIEQYAEVKEYSPISPWKTDELIKKVKEVAQEIGVKLTPAAVELLAESVGNNSRQLWNELEKLQLYGKQENQPLDETVIATLVNANAQNSLQLAQAIRKGNQAEALQLIDELLSRNEPALRIVATLVGQFRTWTIIQLKLEAGESDNKLIAKAADIPNPNRLYFLRKELRGISGKSLLQTLPILLELETRLKRGYNPLETLQIKTIELCQFFN
ncbi:DNA polymerase III subunit delta [Crocosphaera sp.]|uniref:DNA polymerase III subunit delta n=1 Tax=Crocosphaera sp. TaxID=2729996 RepID=UPI00260A1D1E|nr:DNA polymerase III subunit delta [Crocosphaera sp.]MDJ0581650.1 DNA polymerase III subunit delta [Crocosphaera sp.]